MRQATVALKRAATITYGLGQPPPLSPAGVPILRATNIQRGRIRSAGLIFAAIEDLPLDRAPLLESGEILVVRSGAYTGDSALVTPEWSGSAPGYDLRLTPSRDTEPRYLAYSLLSARSLDQMAILRSRAAQPHLNADELGSLSVHLPQRAEQREIADYLDTETARIDALITKKRWLIELLDEQRHSFTLAAVTGTARDLGHESRSSSLAWADDVAAGSDEVLLRLVAKQGTGHTPSREHPEWWLPEECTIPWITTGEVQQVRSDRMETIVETRERISEAGMANSSATLHPVETVFLCRTASAGYSGIMGVDMATSQDFATWTCGPLLRPRYLLFCLRAMRHDLLGRLGTGSTHKTIYMPDIQALRIPLPSPEEQDTIIEWLTRRLDIAHQATDRLTHQIELLVEHRQALITAAVTGEFAVPGAAA